MPKDIEIFRRNGPNRIGVSVGGCIIRSLSIDAATSLMVHLGAVIDWAISKDLSDESAREVAASNRPLTSGAATNKHEATKEQPTK